MDLVSLLLTVVILGAIFSLAWWAISAIPLPPPFRVGAIVILALIGIMVLVQFLPGVGHLGRL